MSFEEPKTETPLKNGSQEHEPKKPFQVYFEQHDTGALSYLDRRVAEIRAREKVALEEAWKKLDVSGPPKPRELVIQAPVKNSEVDRSTRREVQPEALRPEKEHSPSLLQEARRCREKILEKKGFFSLSEEEYKQYFSDVYSGQQKFKQGNVGNCYAVAAIHALSQSENFELMARSSMQRLQDGSWEVRIPLFDRNGKKVTITQGEIQPQENKNFGWHWNFKEDFLFPRRDNRRYLNPVEASEGVRVLEAAYIKSKFGEVDRLSATSGHSDEALLRLGGNNFLGYRVEQENSVLNQLPEAETQNLDHFLETFDPDVYAATASSRSSRSLPGKRLLQALIRGREIMYRGAKTHQKFFMNHAYSIIGVEQQKKMVILTNPHDTTQRIELDFDQFKGTFRSLKAIRINHAELLNNMEAFWRTAQH